MMIPKAARIALLRANLDFLTTLMRRFNGDMEVGLCRMAMHLAEQEGRPADISAVAAMTGLPRTTVLRKLKSQQDVFFVLEGRHMIARCTPPCLHFDEGIQRAFKRFAKLSNLLSKVDTKPFDGESVET